MKKKEAPDRISVGAFGEKVDIAVAKGEIVEISKPQNVNV